MIETLKHYKYLYILFLFFLVLFLLGGHYLITFVRAENDSGGAGAKPALMEEGEIEFKRDSVKEPAYQEKFQEKLQDLPVVKENPESNRYILLGSIRVTDDTEKIFDLAAGVTNYCNKHSCRAIIHTGNIFAPKGVTEIDSPLFQERFEKPYQKLQNIPFYVTVGNHDWWGDPTLYFEYAKKDTNWINHSTFYLEKDFENIDFYFTDSETIGFGPSQQEWLANELSSSNKSKWQVVVGTMPVITNSLMAEKRGAEWGGRQFVGDLLCENEVDFYASGAFALEYLNRLKPECVTSQLNSGGGHEFFEVKEPDENTVFTHSKHGFLSLVVYPEKMVVELVNEKGEVIQMAEKLKN